MKDRVSASNLREFIVEVLGRTSWDLGSAFRTWPCQPCCSHWDLVVLDCAVPIPSKTQLLPH